ncbi:conserved hypothetical protein [Burkholderia pseudomallei Pakistan 9]|uniref:Uncharacterized protein n=1 Tax=Burkholderia pseudomallei 1710a TaxID=320371 RepID=A0A0E1VUG5_BURPE|nr:conserved hypothetical protein [Burkholderia pseudomallei 576]EEH28208.1 conserved hypothetical protein [Burkholderia pseudomallei Pakistan 9]EEP51229.1 conserved hypothetical protein [Burkholderia pseudomallei MSHR346]EET04560.1 hypothetical protein BURPS1710A_A1618 [Burkholderia pseudomallei 1710a]
MIVEQTPRNGRLARRLARASRRRPFDALSTRQASCDAARVRGIAIRLAHREARC